MGFKISNAHDLMAKALDGSALRQKIIAGNIANANTPFYKAKGIDFETSLAKQLDNKSNSLALATTHHLHLNGSQSTNNTNATVFIRDGHTTRNDGNSVDIDVETTQMSKNTMMFNALSAALKKDSMIFKSVLDASSKMQ